MDGLRQIGRVIVRTPLLIAAITAVVVLGGGIFVFAANSSGGNDDPTEVFLEPADSVGTNPFVNLLKTPVPTVVLARDLLPKDLKAGTASLAGGTVGLYGGTLNDTQCDREQMITFLTQNPDHAKAWAGVQNITTAQIPTYIRSLTPVQLRLDTRVTNHGYTDGTANPLQSVLQAGTAVLIDRNGVPRARCACGNPLLPPQPTTNTTYTGTPWNNFSAAQVVRVTPNNTEVKAFILHDAATGKLFTRPVGTAGEADAPYSVPAPKTTGGTTTTGVFAPQQGSSTTAGIAPSSSSSSTDPSVASTDTTEQETTTTRATTATTRRTTSTTARPTTTAAPTLTTAPATTTTTRPPTTTTTRPTTTTTRPTTTTTTAPTTTTTAPTTTTTEPTTTTTEPTTTTTQSVTVPDLRGLDLNPALGLLKQLGLRGEIVAEYCIGGNFAANTVCRHSPGPGRVVPPGTVITVVYHDPQLG